MDPLFKVHMLNETGRIKAEEIADCFDVLLGKLEKKCPTEGRLFAIVKTKLEEACFFAKKAMATQTENQQRGETE